MNGTSKNLTGQCPYCNGKCEPTAEQGDDRYEKRHCKGCQRYSALKRGVFVSYPLVDADDPNSGWVVCNPNIEATRTP